MNYFDIKFNNKEIEILKNNKIIIIDNQRYYLYDKNDKIPRFSVPYLYSIADFNYEGNSWTKLLLDFGNWYSDKYENNFDLIQLKNSYNQPIFSLTKEINYIGPLKRGYYINNKLGSNSWTQIADMLNLVNYPEIGIILIHFPFQRESLSVTDMIYYKEKSLFFRYLLGLGYNLSKVKEHIENLNELNNIYYKIKFKETKNNQPISNHKIITASNKLDLSNAISQIRTSNFYSSKFYPTIENLNDFKSEVYYDNRNYSEYSVNKHLPSYIVDKLSTL